MEYTDRYEYYLDQLPETAAYAKEHSSAPLFGFSSNFDIVLHWDAEAYNRILDKHLKEAPYAKEGDTIDDLSDFARISAAYIVKGLGGNFDITDVSVCRFLRSAFTEEPALGGTGAQGAAALGALGIPVSMHLTDDCAEVCRMLDHEGTTVIRGGKKVRVGSAASDADPVYHIILQFQKGDIVRFGGEEHVIPVSNRLILFYDKVHKVLPIKDPVLSYWEQTDEKPSSILLSGFDAIVDTAIIGQRIAQLESFLKKLKARSPETVIYLEGAFYMSSEVKDLIFGKLGPYADIAGMNEEELEAELVKMGERADLSNLDGILAGLRVMLSFCRSRAVLLHTKDYSMFYGKKPEGVDIEAGLTIGNLMAGTRARVGRYGTLSDLRESLGMAELSKRGLEILSQQKAREDDAGRSLVIVPSKLLERPKYTIGLGDTFVAGMHTCFIRKDRG